jgi:hypothetical protein
LGRSLIFTWILDEINMILVDFINF